MWHHIILKAETYLCDVYSCFFTPKHIKSHTPIHCAGFFSSMGTSLQMHKQIVVLMFLLSLTL